MAFAGICPYLKDSRSPERTICECAKFTFPDKTSRRDVLYKYCGHPTGWKKCTFKAVLDSYYEREFSAEKKQENICANSSASKRQGTREGRKENV